MVDDKQLEDLKNYVKLARETAYFGKYSESINTFKKAIETISRLKASSNEPMLIDSWSKFEIDLSNELEVIQELNAINLGLRPSQVSSASNKPQQQQQQQQQQLEQNKKFPFGKAPFTHQFENNNDNNNYRGGPQQNNYPTPPPANYNQPPFSNARDYNQPVGPSSQPSGMNNNNNNNNNNYRNVGGGGYSNNNNNYSRNASNGGGNYNGDSPIDNGSQPNFHVEFYQKPAAKNNGGNNNSNEPTNDPDVWPAPPPPTRKVNSKPAPAKNNMPYNLNNLSNNPSTAANANGNGSAANAAKRRDYQKPWQKNAVEQTPAGKRKGGSESEDGKKKSFLNFVYPDGNGPDSNLIAMLEREVVDTNPNISFDQIAELDKAKDMLQEAVLLPILIPQYFRGIRRPLKGAMMFGPPGTGKTMLAKAVATTGKTTFFNVSASSLASKWKGDSEKLVRILFEMARYYSPSTIFFDEIDAIGSKRVDGECEASRKMKAEMLIQIDGVNNSSTDEKDRKQVMVLAATNRPWDLDEALRRRLEKRILIPLPSAKGRTELFKLNMKGINVVENLDWEGLVAKTEGYSGADIASICREAAFMPMRRKLIKEGGFRNIENIENLASESDIPLTLKDFEDALKNVNKSVSTDDLENFEKWMNEFGSV